MSEFDYRQQAALIKLCMKYPMPASSPALEKYPRSFLTPEEMLALIECAEVAPPGCFVEVGVYKGGSAYHLMRVAMAQQRVLYLYDTFSGMPYSDPTIDSIAVGDVNLGNDTSEAEVRALLGEYPYIEACVFPLVKIPPCPPIAFAHIDVDQYKAHIETCRFLEPLMAPGGVMWFDDVPVLESARKAVIELYAWRPGIERAPNGRWLVRFP